MRSGVKRRFILSGIVLLSLLAIATPLVHSEPQTPSLEKLEQGITEHLQRVDEFRFIEQDAEKLGIQGWIFGGTAAGYSHDVKWDMLRQDGDKRFQPDRFDYDYTNIYRSTQDLDIVIDGNPKQADTLQQALMAKYPHLQGSKTAWEVRLLTQSLGDKLALLDNPDFLNQHTDSNSTGMIEITKPKSGESVVRDLRDWNSHESQFIKDIHDDALHYYFSPSHDSTRFAREGRNPPILSVIRYLTKAFQYELKMRDEDLAQIKKIIDEFNPKRDAKNDYVSNWIEKNGKKLFQNAVNIEYAWNTLEKLGLRQKLIPISNDANRVDGLAWWMNKEPLRSHPLGEGTGKTARELGLDVVAHETNNFLAYESITRAHTGDANVLTSRDGKYGETAVYGDGFYTRTGREGARGTGLTIRFHLHPDAREGTDFVIDKLADTYIIVKNKAALQVIPESLSLSPVEYFKLLATDAQLNHSDLGIFEKLKRRTTARMNALSAEDVNEISSLVKAEIGKERPLASPLLYEWFSRPFSGQYPELLDTLFKIGSKENVESIEWLLAKPHWLPDPRHANHPEWMERMIRKVWFNELSEWKDYVRNVLALPHWRNNPELRRLVNNEEPTWGNLTRAFRNGKSLLPNPSGCVVSNLSYAFRATNYYRPYVTGAFPFVTGTAMLGTVIYKYGKESSFPDQAPVACSSINPRTAKLHDKCTTSKGAIYERVSRDHFGEAWKGPDGLVWSDRVGNYTQSNAAEICKKLDGTPPSKADFERSEGYGLREVLSNMTDLHSLHCIGK